ncbi:hypothetical protein [Bradyrhizobium sp. BR 1432]|uniref:hypothetical protein n=1 Tax=Bradyrhizobium sp. BR 1432 TaxID=3447966 RepID=UPI003EE7DE60
MRIAFQRDETPNVFVSNSELSALAGGRPCRTSIAIPCGCPSRCQERAVDWHDAGATTDTDIHFRLRFNRGFSSLFVSNN